MVQAKIIVAQKIVAFHFWGLYFFKKNPYYYHVHWFKCPQYWDSHSSEVLVLTEKSTLPGVYMVKHWLCFLPEAVSSISENSHARGWGGNLSFHHVNDTTAPFLCRRSGGEKGASRIGADGLSKFWTSGSSWRAEGKLKKIWKEG